MILTWISSADLFALALSEPGPFAVLFAVAVLFAAERFERARFWRAARGTLPDLVNALGSVARAVREAPSRATQDEGGPAMGPSFACAIRCADAELRGLQDPLGVRCDFHDLPEHHPCPDESPLELATRWEALGASETPAGLPEGCCSKRTYDALLAAPEGQEPRPLGTPCALHDVPPGTPCPEPVPEPPETVRPPGLPRSTPPPDPPAPEAPAVTPTPGDPPT